MQRRLGPLAAFLAAALALPALAQVPIETLAPEQAQQYAAGAIRTIQEQIPNPPLRTDLDASNALGIRVADDVGMLAIPQKGLARAALVNAGEEPVTVGALVLLNVLPLAGGHFVEAAKVTELRVPDAPGKLYVIYLGVRKEGDRRVLSVYGRDRAPLLSVPLEESASDGDKPLASRVANIDEASQTGDMIFTIAGAFRATLRGGRVAP